MIEISSAYIDVIAIAWLLLVVAFIVDWTLSRKEYYGEYVAYRGIPFPVVWFAASAVGAGISCVWLFAAHIDLIVEGMIIISGMVKVV